MFFVRNILLYSGLQHNYGQSIFILNNTESPRILPYKPYLMYASLYVKRITNLFMTEYNARSYFDAIKPHMIYVHFMEPRSSCLKT